MGNGGREAWDEREVRAADPVARGVRSPVREPPAYTTRQMRPRWSSLMNNAPSLATASPVGR
jgi:hypothetical protein